MSILADLPLNIVPDRLGQALSWWLGELLSIWRDAVRWIASAGGRSITITAGDDCWIIRRGSHWLGEIDWSQGDATARQHRLRELVGYGGRYALVLVEIPPERVLSKIANMPAAAHAELDRMIPFEIARQFPFPAERVFYRHRIVGGSAGAARSAGRSLSVEIVVVPRDVVVTIADRLADVGLRVGAVSLPGTTTPLLLTPDAIAGPPVATSRQWLAIAVWMMVSLAAISWPLAQQFRLAAIESEIAALKPGAEATLRSRQSRQHALDQTAEIARLLGSRPFLTAVLDTLSRDLPDGSWLTSLSIAGHDVLLEGTSPSAATIALALGRDAQFTAISFRSPIARDAASGHEHFQLAAKIIESQR